ncbi:GNAT family N-acetyltransferase [Streptomyces sp. NPDC088910]|uniref:GNAT family N-acetyltransferase n=1 Tax=Streptomyces sp. NPDC088910 TaxID=3365911 RepID=UPI0037FDE1D9
MGVAIRRAGADDREVVVGVLDKVFRNDPVSSWVFPDPEHRLRKHASLMGAFADQVLADGYVDMTEDGKAVALWMSIPATSDAPEDAQAHADDDDPAAFREAVDPDNERVEQIARILGEGHPTGPAHEYLLLIAVDAELQGQSRGTELISAVLERCDRDGLSAYLEASSERSRGLYERLGFVFTGRTIDLPDGPHMWPMWREPRAAAV